MTLVWKSGLNLQSPTANDPLLDLNTQPSLDLQFATSKTLDDRVSGLPLVNHQRDASSGKSAGTYVGSDGLIKTSPVNLYFPSTLTAMNWSSPATFTETDNYGIAPDGTNSSLRVTATATGYLQAATNVEAGTTYTLSVYIKLEVIRSTTFRIGVQGPAVNSTLNKDVLSELVVGQWVRVFVTFTADNTATTDLRLMSATNADAEFWGVQLEEGTTATDYIPTGATISGAPRFDHDPVTGESLGLLIEESRTNLITYSIDFSNWFNISGGSGIDPVKTPNLSGGQDGTATVTKLEFDVTGGSTGGDVSLVGLNYTSTGGVSYTLSAWIRADSTFKINFACDTVSTNEEEVTTEWKRITYTQNSGVAGTRQVRIGLRADQNVPDTATIYIWGVQLEENATFPTSYIPTTGSTVTRAADVASIEGTNFSSWYNQSEGTVFVELGSDQGGVPARFQLSDDSGVNRIQSRKNQLYCFNGTQQFNLSYTSSLKEASAVSGTSTSVAASGSVVATHGSASLPTCTNMELGKRGGNFDYLNGHITRLAYYPYRLADATLQEITS